MVTYDSDRAVKYGFGVVRLAALTLLAFVLVHPRPRGPDSSIDAAPTMLDCVLGQSGTSWLLYRSSDYVVDASACGSLKDGWAAIPGWVLSQIDVSALLSYRSSHRWLGHVYIGSIGALVNVEALPFTANVLLLLLAGAFCLIDVQLFDYSSVVYLVKTFGGDFFAGKLDTAEWKLVLFGVFGILLPYSLMSELDPTDTVLAYRHILPLLMAVQFVCEYGDNHLEHWRFFRYRYSFELFTALILILLPLTAAELDVVLFDLVICTAYRLSNFLIQLCCGVYASQPLRKLLFYLYGYLANTRVINVTDPDLAVLVLQRSNVKGLGIERNLASPAWLPAMNVESVDGRVWEGMIANLHVLMRQLPPVSELTDIATRLADEVVAENTIIDANVIARLTLKMFLEYAMGLRWRDEFELFVTASWEWRKEIAVKGKADMNVKNRTVELVLRLIREASQEERSRMTKAQIASKFVTRSDGSAPKDLWVIFGENWKRPEYFSLLLQPFILSPCINTGDASLNCYIKHSIHSHIYSHLITN